MFSKEGADREVLRTVMRRRALLPITRVRTYAQPPQTRAEEPLLSQSTPAGRAPRDQTRVGGGLAPQLCAEWVRLPRACSRGKTWARVLGGQVQAPSPTHGVTLAESLFLPLPHCVHICCLDMNHPAKRVKRLRGLLSRQHEPGGLDRLDVPSRSCGDRMWMSSTSFPGLKEGVDGAAFLLEAPGENPLPRISSSWRHRMARLCLLPPPQNPRGRRRPLTCTTDSRFCFWDPSGDSGPTWLAHTNPSNLESADQRAGSHLQQRFPFACNLTHPQARGAGGWLGRLWGEHGPPLSGLLIDSLFPLHRWRD